MLRETGPSPFELRKGKGKGDAFAETSGAEISGTGLVAQISVDDWENASMRPPLRVCDIVVGVGRNGGRFYAFR